MAAGLRLRNGYDVTIEQIKAQGGDKSRPGKTALRWITHAERPLRANELCHTHPVKLGFTDFDIGNLPGMSTFRELLSIACDSGYGGINCAIDPLYSPAVLFSFSFLASKILSWAAWTNSW